MGDISRKEKQRSFAGGEYSSAAQGRDDLDLYGQGVKKALNFIPLPYGPATTRPGSRYAVETYQSGAAVVRQFNFADDDSLVLVFTEGRLRILRDAAPVNVRPAPPAWVFNAWASTNDLCEYGGLFYRATTDMGPGTNAWVPPRNPGSWAPITIDPVTHTTTPYAAADLPNLRFSQVGDVVTITCRGKQEYELTRLAADVFRFAPVAYSTLPASFMGALAVGLVYPLPTSDANNPAKDWKWRVTTVFEDDATGRLIESAPFEITQSVEWAPSSYAVRDLPAKVVCTAGKPQMLKWGVLDNGLYIQPTAGWYRINSWRMYRGREDVFGLVGILKAPPPDALSWYGTYSWMDHGDEPNYNVRPPQGRNPFYFPGDDTRVPPRAARTERPWLSCFHEQRRILGPTDERRATLALSATGDYSKFDKWFPVVADDALEPELASMRFEEIRALVPGEPLVVLTSGAEWTLQGGGVDEPITATGSFRARARTEHGSAWVAPVRVGSTVIFVQAKGNVVRGFGLNGDGSLEDEDFSIRARHFFRRRRVVELAYAEDPWGIVWAVLDDGTLLSFTFSKKYGAWGWAKHAIAGGGAVESICTVPEGDEDTLYMVVRRTIAGATRRYVERLARATLEGDALADAVYLDSAVTLVNVTSVENVATVSGLGHLEGLTVAALVDGNVVRTDPAGAPLVVASGAIRLPDDAGAGFAKVTVGLSYDCDLQQLDARTEKERRKLVSRAWVEVNGSRGGKVGASFDSLVEWPSREVTDDYFTPQLASKVYEVPLKGKWAKNGSVAIRQSDPLPVTVVSITRQIEFGG